MRGNYNRKFISVVNKSLQYRFLATMLIYFIILILFFGITLFLPDIMQMYNKSLSMEIRGAAAERMLFKHVWVWPIVLVLSGLMGLHSFRSFQRVAGPLYRFRWAFEQIRNGNLGLIVKIREKDYLHPEENSLNEMLRTIESQMERVKKGTNDALNSFKKIEEKISEDNNINQDQQELTGLHHQHLNDILKAIEYFKLGANSK